MIKAVIFDLFGTVLDASNVPVEEKRDYIRQVRKVPPAHLILPDSWYNLKAFPDAKEGIERLRNVNKCLVITCSNLPGALQIHLMRENDIYVDNYALIESIPVYKPDPEAYKLALLLAHPLPAEQVLMVTGNEGSPDLTAPLALGMQTQRIRGDGGPTDIIELAKMLE